MLRWGTSLFLFLALAGQVWAGICGCSEDHNDSHSCCKRDKSGKDFFTAPPCCDDDCESITGSQIPGKKSERVSQAVHSKHIASDPVAVFWHRCPVVVKPTVASAIRLGHRLKHARPPDAIYLRNNSFLI